MAVETPLLPYKSPCESWDAENPEIYREFRTLALHLIHRGILHYGAKAICEVIRFHRVVESHDVYKVNNTMASYFARKFMREYPEYPGFFETRRSRLDG